MQLNEKKNDFVKLKKIIYICTKQNDDDDELCHICKVYHCRLSFYLIIECKKEKQ